MKHSSVSLTAPEANAVRNIIDRCMEPMWQKDRALKILDAAIQTSRQKEVTK